MKQHLLSTSLQIPSKTPHLLIAGLPGMGKDNFGEGYITKKIGKYKVFDLHNESRGEGMYYSLKQDDIVMQNRMKALSNGILKPRAYKNKIIMFLGHNLKKMPILPKNVEVCVFNEQWLSNDDLKDFLVFNESQSGLLDTIFEIHEDKHITLTELYNFLLGASKENSKEKRQLKNYGGAHYLSISTIKRRCRSILRSGIFYNDDGDIPKYFKYLNLEDEARSRDVLTTFSTYLIEDEYISFVCFNVLLKKLIELIELRQVNIPLLFYIRELNDFYFQKQNAPSYVISIRNSIEKILRRGRFLGRSKIMVVANTQLPNDLPSVVFNSFNKFVVFRLPLSESKRFLNKATIPLFYLYKIHKLEVGMAMYIANGMFYYPERINPTQHKKSEPEFDVFTHLNKVYQYANYKNSNFISA